jgi:hypothetical protein
MSAGSKSPTGYQPAQQGAADSAYMSGADALTSGGQALQATAIPGYQSLYSNVQNNPYYAGAQAASGQTAALGQQFQTNATADQTALNQMGTQLGAYAPGIMQTAFDPQNALYQQQYQQQMDQQNAINAMYGVGGSPYGAGTAGQTANNFNLNWQNNQQQRQLAGVQGLQGLTSAMSGAYAGAQNLGQTGIDVGYQTSQLPNATYTQQQAQVQAALDALVNGTNSSFSTTQQAVGDYGTYLKLGQSATANAQNAAQMNSQSDAAGLAGLGKLAGAGLTYFGGPAGAMAGSILAGAGNKG